MGIFKPYGNIHRRTEADIREELNRFLDGHFPEIAKGQTTVLRKMRRDSSGELTKCPCVDNVTGEPDLDTYCPSCMGSYYLWDEVFIDAYKVRLRSSQGNAFIEESTKPGLVSIPAVKFLVRASVTITQEDKVVELKRGAEGNPLIPYRRSILYRVGSAIDIRSDNGRIEYWQLSCHKEDVKFLNGPG